MDGFDDELIALLPNLRRFALSLCRSSDTADDLVQMTCQKAIVARTRFEAGTRMDAWLFRILHNTWIDMTRSAKTAGTRIDIDEAFDLRGEDGQDTTENRLMLDRTMREIAELPDDQREVVLLVCVEELSYKEVADIVGAPIGTVMSRLARARRKLADRLGINGGPPRSSPDTEEKAR